MISRRAQWVVWNGEQGLADSEQLQARNNIGAAAASDVTALRNDVDALSNVSVYTVKGEATVAELNAGPAGIQAGWSYILTNAGTLTDGSLVVNIGDTVAWDGTKWFALITSDYYATKTYAQNVAHSIVPEFDPNRTSENKYIIGQSCVYGGVTYTFINNHYGAWSSSDAIVSDEHDRLPLAFGKSFDVVGANLTIQYKVFPCDGVGSVKVVPKTNPWPTDTIGGTNPSIFILYAVDSSGVTTKLVDYTAGNVPNEITATLPLGTKFLKFFVRANNGVSVGFDVYNCDVIDCYSDVSALKSDVIDLQTDVIDLQTDVTTHNVVNIPLTGANGTAQIVYIGIKGLSAVNVKPTPNPWLKDSIGGSNPNVLILSAVNSAGTETVLKKYSVSATIPEVVELTIPSGTEKLRLFMRANSGSVVDFEISNPLIVGLPEQKTILENSVKNFGEEFNSTVQYVVGKNLTKSGALYRAIYPHLGAWDSSHFVDGDEFILNDFDSSKIMSFVGAGLTSKNLYVFLSGPKDKFVLTHSSWPVNTIGGSNPSLLQVFAIAADGSETRVSSYTANSGIPDRINVTLPTGTKALRIFVRANSGSAVDIYLDDYELYIAGHTKFISYEKSKQIKSLAMSYGSALKKFVLMGDPHAESAAFEAYKQLLSEYSFDGILVLGDICPSSPTGATAYDAWNAFVSGVSTLILPVIGNHDVGQGASILDYVPLSKSVENVMGPCVDKGDIATTYGYYYKDVVDIRFIVVNDYNIDGVYDADSKWERVAYDSSKPQIAFSTAYSQNDIVNVGVWTDYSYRAKENVTTPASNPTSLVHTFPCWSNRPDVSSVDAVQAQWVLDTMLATPSNMGIVIVKHSVLSTDFFIDYKSKFTQQHNASAGTTLVGDFYVDAVDAYNEGVAFSTTVGGVAVSADFSGKNDSVFVGFISGHQHRDLILRSTNKPKYYDICVNMTAHSYYGWTNDVWVDSGDVSATVACFDRHRKSTNLMKVGVDMTCDGYRRDNERIKQEYNV